MSEIICYVCPQCSSWTGDFQNEKINCRFCNTLMIETKVLYKDAYKNEEIEKNLKEKYAYNNPLYNEELDKQLHDEVLKQALENERNGSNQSTSEFDNTLFFLLFTFGSIIGGFITFYQLAIKREYVGLGLFLCMLILLLGQYLCKKLSPNTSKEVNEQIKQDRDSKNNKMCNPGLKCPVCGSHYVVKIGALNRAASVHFWGLASSKIGKQYECKDCHHKF